MVVFLSIWSDCWEVERFSPAKIGKFINKHSLKLLKIDKAYVNDILAKKKLTKRQVYLMLIDDKKNVKIFKKE